jgi:predicted nucleic acid-binding protein
VNWVKRLSGHIVAVDSAPLIYFMERHTVFLETVQPFFEAINQGEFVALTSSVTITELLALPLRHGRSSIVDAYQELFANFLPIVSVTAEIAELAAQLRADHNLRTPDAIQIATAINHQADAFLTNDIRLSRLKQLEILVLADLTD